MPVSVFVPHGTCKNFAAPKTCAPVCGWRACGHVALVHPAGSRDVRRSESKWLLLCTPCSCTVTCRAASMGYPEDTPEALLSQGLLARLQSTEACTKDGSSPTQHRPAEKQGDAKHLLFAAVCMGHAQVGCWQKKNSKVTTSNVL